ncbi:hypothetical protein AB0I22_36195 [Streptomyces sp. NPDC050610]|uniref:hypothetical protein n=1 Tax=Streptomyces sp. NPDC050610 TaxID=3157097 RepID=UPI00343E0863
MRRARLEASVLPTAYRDLLEVLADAGTELRAKQFAVGIGLGSVRLEALRSATAEAAARVGPFRTRLALGEKPALKRMATLAAVYDATPATRCPHDVIALPGGRHGRRRLRPGPRAEAKWLTGSVIQDTDEVIQAAFDQA